MSTPHIDAGPGAIAETVLLPGDPLRARFIAQTVLDDPLQVTARRNMLGFTGRWQGRPVTVMGGVPYAAASGELGEGAMAPLVHHGGDVWRMPCPRALDFSAPGDWTLDFRGGGLRVGCWLARGIDYARM